MPTTIHAGICALCRTSKELRVSHIASKFLWKQSGIIGHQKSFSIKSPTHPELNDDHLQDGFKEYLLCQRCEEQFSAYETYAARALFHASGPLRNRPNTHHSWTGLDYAQLKLFQMSILWRMGVSTHPFYGMVNLGKHEEILRRMLKEEDPGEPWRYGCIATLLDHGGKPLSGIFSQPLRMKKFGRQCFSYTIAGMHWRQFVTSHSFEESSINRMLLQPNGTWVFFLGETSHFPELTKQIELYRQAHQKT